MTTRSKKAPPGSTASGGSAAVNWIDANQEMPDDEMLVLVATELKEVWPAFHEGGEWRDPDASKLDVGVTHWCQMPEPPNVKLTP